MSFTVSDIFLSAPFSTSNVMHSFALSIASHILITPNIGFPHQLMAKLYDVNRTKILIQTILSVIYVIELGHT